MNFLFHPRTLVIPIFIPHAGCPHQCLFCDQKGITGELSENLNIHSATNQIERFLTYGKGGYDSIEIAFFGGNFLGIPFENIIELLNLAKTFVDQKKVHGIRFSTRPDTITEKILDKIEGFPISTIEIGAQSMDDTVLKQAHRGHSAQNTIASIELIKKKKIKVGVQLMVGLPGETSDKAINSAHILCELVPDFIRIYPTVVMQNSPLATLFTMKKYQPLSLEDAVERVHHLFLLFTQKNIPIIRMGLQAQKDLVPGGTILAGPYHPSFGHLVYAKHFNFCIMAHLEKHPLNSKTIKVIVAPRRESQARGLNNQNIHEIKQKFQLEQITVVEDAALSGFDFIIEPGGVYDNSVENSKIESRNLEN